MEEQNNQYEAKYQELYNKLNANQKLAVDNIDGPVMVVAGPGTGKTQTISLRIANILRQTQLDPENILCLTFTESAVNTMRKRLFDIIGTAAYNIKIYTFHGFCNEVILTHPEKFLEFGAISEPLSDIDKFKVFSGLIDELPYDSVLKPFGNTESYIWEIPAMISGFKRDNISIAEIETAVRKNIEFRDKTVEVFKKLKAIPFRQLSTTTFTSLINELQALGFADFGFVNYLIELIGKFKGERYAPLRNQVYDAYEDGFKDSITRKQEEFINIFRNYQAVLKSEGKYDYDDMIQGVVKQFGADKALLTEYQEKFQYVLVDEFQDTNSSQNEVLRLLGSFWSDPNLFVVGDDDQSIFRFQGASVENMIFFYNTYLAKIRVVALTENYRSQQLILDAARAVIANNGLQVNEMIPNLSKELTAKHQDYALTKINVLECKDPMQEAYELSTRIQALLTQGVIGKEIAIIYRDNSDADPIIEALSAAKIVYRLEKGEDILDNPQIMQLVNLINYVVNPDDAINFFELLNYKFLGFDKFDLVKLFNYASHNRLDYLTLMTDEAKLTEAGITNKDGFTKLGNNLAEWRQELYNTKALIFFNKLIRDSGFLKYITALPEQALILNKLSRLYEELKGLQHGKDDYNLASFSADMTIYKKYHIQLNDKLWGSDNDNAIRLMTGHGAKGMEFEHVFIARCQDKKWGSRTSPNKVKPPYGLMPNQFVSLANDEERRLFFVAMTRAKKELNISYSRYNSKQKEQSPSKFIQEIPEQLINKQVINKDDDAAAAQFLKVITAETQLTYSEAAREMLQNLLSTYSLNVSNLIAYRKCPRCFYFNTLIHVPQVKSRPASMGTAIHLALKTTLDELKRTGSLPLLEYVLKQFVTVLREEHMEEKEFLAALKQGELLLTDFYGNRQQEFLATSLSELNFKHSNVVVNGIPLTGKIDRVDSLDPTTGELAVIDYKTGNPDSAGARLSVDKLGDYYLQLVFYKILVENSHLLKGRVVKGRVEFLMRSKEKGEFTPKDYDLGPETVTPVLELIKNTYDSIMTLDFARINTDSYNTCDHPEFHDLEWSF